MKINRIKFALMIPAVFLIWNIQPAYGQDSIASESATQINTANSLVRDGKYDEAIEQYAQVQPTATDRDELDYNLAVAQFRKGELDAAEELFATSAASSDTKIAASSRYNLGNCLYSKALTSAEQDKTLAIEQLKEAISHYRDSLKLEGSNADARANIELAGELIRKLQEEQQQDQQEQQQQQDQQQQDQHQQDQQNQSQDQSGEGQQDQQNDEQKDSQDSQSKDQQSQSQSDQSKDEQSEDSQNDKSQSGEQNSEQQESEKQNSGEEQSQSQSQEDQNQSQNSESQQENSENDSQDQESSQQQSEGSESQQDQQSQAHRLSRRILKPATNKLDNPQRKMPARNLTRTIRQYPLVN